MRVLIGGTPTGTLKHISADTYRRQCGMLTSWRDRSRPIHALRLGSVWAIDNYAYADWKNGIPFHDDEYAEFLKTCEGIPGCLFCVAPDVIQDAKATATKFDHWYDAVKRYGYPIALAAQNGLEDIPIDWKHIDALFIGGDDRFKFSPFVQQLIEEARALGKWTHNGRINSLKRWTYGLLQNVDSVDGSGLAIARKRVLEPLAVMEYREQYMFEF